MKSWEYPVRNAMLAGALADILAEAGKDSVLAQIHREPFDAAAVNAATAGTITIRLCIVPAEIVPRIKELTDKARAKREARLAAAPAEPPEPTTEPV